MGFGDGFYKQVPDTAVIVNNMAELGNLKQTEGGLARVKSTGELFEWDETTSEWAVIAHSSIKKEFFDIRSSSNQANWPTIFVSTSGNDVSGEGTIASPFATVPRALKNVPTSFKNNIIISVAPGEYATGLGLYDSEAWVAPEGKGWIHIVGQEESSEVVTLDTANRTASTVPHPSGLGNYISFREFNNFPVWQTSIPGTFSTVHPTFNQGDEPSYLFQKRNILDNGVNFYMYGQRSLILPGSDNTNGKLRLLATSIYQNGEYDIIHKESLPHFPAVSAMGIKTIAKIRFGRLQASNTPFQYTECRISGCFIDNIPWGHTFSNVSINGSVLSRGTNNTEYASINIETQGLLCGFGGNYTNVPIYYRFGAGGWVDRSIFDTTSYPSPKLVLGGIGSGTNYAAGDATYISYMGYVDFIGSGDGIRMGGVCSVSPYNSMTFDGVTSPLLIHNGGNWGRRGGTAIGTSTSYSIIGVASSTGPSNVKDPEGVGISNWNVQNTTNPGEEIKVGRNNVTTYSSLPQTDFLFGTGSLGAIAR